MFELLCCAYDCKMEAADEDMANPDDDVAGENAAETGADIALAIKAVEVDDECIMLELLLLPLLWLPTMATPAATAAAFGTKCESKPPGNTACANWEAACDTRAIGGKF
jgi:hypothetical protein